jgi:uncharacterized protein YciI
MPLTRVAIVIALASTAAVFAEDALPKPPMAELETYVIGFLRKGPNWGAGSKEEGQRIMEGHMANIRKMAETGKLLLAGPFGDDTDLRGMFLFRVNSLDEARNMVAADPAVQAGRFVLELHPWFARKGLVTPPPPKP